MQNPSLFVGLCTLQMSIIGVRLWGVTVCRGVQKIEALVRTHGCLEDGGGLPVHRVIYTPPIFCRTHGDVTHGGIIL
jgi:hypothetical protein